MKLKNILSVIAFVFGTLLAQAQIFTAKTCEIKIFSDGPIEDIDAVNKASKVILNTANGEIAVVVPIKSFDFEKELMEEHFNEKYMESDKYKTGTFKGKINEKLDYTKDGVHKVTVTGKLNIHNVDKDRTLEGTVTIKGGEITLDSKFIIPLKDHNVEIPSMMAQNIAENIETTLKATLTELKK